MGAVNTRFRRTEYLWLLKFCKPGFGRKTNLLLSYKFQLLSFTRKLKRSKPAGIPEVSCEWWAQLWLMETPRIKGSGDFCSSVKRMQAKPRPLMLAAPPMKTHTFLMQKLLGTGLKLHQEVPQDTI